MKFHPLFIFPLLASITATSLFLVIYNIAHGSCSIWQVSVVVVYLLFCFAFACCIDYLVDSPVQDDTTVSLKCRLINLFFLVALLCNTFLALVMVPNYSNYLDILFAICTVASGLYYGHVFQPAEFVDRLQSIRANTIAFCVSSAFLLFLMLYPTSYVCGPPVYAAPSAAFETEVSNLDLSFFSICSLGYSVSSVSNPSPASITTNSSNSDPAINTITMRRVSESTAVFSGYMPSSAHYIHLHMSCCGAYHIPTYPILLKPTVASVLNDSSSCDVDTYYTPANLYLVVILFSIIMWLCKRFLPWNSILSYFSPCVNCFNSHYSPMPNHLLHLQHQPSQQSSQSQQQPQEPVSISSQFPSRPPPLHHYDDDEDNANQPVPGQGDDDYHDDYHEYQPSDHYHQHQSQLELQSFDHDVDETNNQVSNSSVDEFILQQMRLNVASQHSSNPPNNANPHHDPSMFVSIHLPS